MDSIIASLAPEANPNIPAIRSGDTVRVHQRIVEGTRERIQVLQGVIISIGGKGANKSFTVRRIAAANVGVERTFLYASPRIETVEIVRRAKVRRKQLYFLRKYRGKAARLKEDRSSYNK